ncbi:pyrroline-5-carboxylate reductase [Periweissella fabaria]|uniref:Pyrroline-5-carboxylate reductase n=1 Tax=Periweissella fabaria TaxID=546157 RepID=A0ABN8BI29_9LACO|nr:pyrroline-5-carboxylate reductase [Periweissella fabaria]MCM0598012.1 pyrroline-5-carboxylate reductase [Periweissella fabaria]CAH0417387.1 Pyrroline-5-carboxylate reductase [Periweissella fabaria]
MKIGFIGGGQMAQAMISGILNTNSEQVINIHGGSIRTEKYAHAHGLNYVESNKQVALESDVVILACLPQHLTAVAAEIKSVLTTQVIISVLGGVTLATLSTALGDNVAISRVLPNTPVNVNAGTIAYIHNEPLLAQSESANQVDTLLQQLGSSYLVSEDQFSIFSALAGSSPAFIDLFIDAMAQAGVKYGLPKDQAIAIVTQTMLGTALQVQASNQTPRELAAAVASPGGSTIAGFLAMEEYGLPTAVVKGIDATIAKDQAVD